MEAWAQRGPYQTKELAAPMFRDCCRSICPNALEEGHGSSSYGVKLDIWFTGKGDGMFYRIGLVGCAFCSVVAKEHDECVVKLALLLELVQNFSNIDVH